MIKKISIIQWVAILIVALSTVDIMQQHFALKIYNQNSDVIQFKKLSSIVASSENNGSIERMKITELLTHIDENAKVYIIKEGDGKVSVLAHENSKTTVVKNIPYSSMIYTIESKFIDKQIAYEWIKNKKKPQLFASNILNSPFWYLVFLGAFIIAFLYGSGIRIFQKEFHSRSPEEIEGDFSDLVGYEDIKTEARQLQYIITQKEKYAQYGIESTFNILFSGKAGTGKSKFALYLAKDLNIPIISSTGSLDETYVGSGARKIRKLFKKANKLAKNSKYKSCILFIDEGQNLLRTRGRNSDHKWEDDTSNEFLAHLDGVEKNSTHNIIVIIASNFHEDNMEMDEAMLRRFKKKIHFREPNLEEREAILLHYLEKVAKKETDIDVTYLAKNMSGMTPAIIESIVQEAGLMALRSGKIVDTSLLLQAFERMVVGQSSRVVTKGEDKTRRNIAVHEVGHFLIEYHRAMLVSGGDILKAKDITRILKISSESIAQVGVLGFVMREQTEEVMLQNVEDMEWDVKQLYGGIAAEELVCGKNGCTTGGADDIKKATRLLQHMVVENSVYSTSKLNYEMLESKEHQIQTIEEKSKDFYEESMRILKENELLLLHLSGVLMEDWSLSKDEIFEEILGFNSY